MAKKHVKPYAVYILRCSDNSLYTGITTDVRRRYRVHAQGKGAAYTRSHPPMQLVYSELCESRGVALKREHAIKKLTKDQKELLVAAKK